MSWNGVERRKLADRRSIHCSGNSNAAQKIIKITDILNEIPAKKYEVAWNIPIGTATARGVAERLGVFSIILVKMTAGSEFPIHKEHLSKVGGIPCREWGIVITGKFELMYGDKKRIIEPRHTILPEETKQIHGGNALEDTEMLWITMPDAEGYPNGRPE
jgi:hypothetical protein